MPEAAIRVEEFTVSVTCSDIRKSIHFYTVGLGFEMAHNMEKDGKLQFAVLKAGSATIALDQDDFAKGRDRVKGIGLRVWLNTPQDIVVLADRATSAGIKLDDGPKALPWGPMAFTLTDPDGFKLTVANPTAD